MSKLVSKFLATKTSLYYLPWILHVIGLSLAYFVTGKLGISLAIPPGYATAIWPPSGIALAGILIYGSRVWPGVFLGSMLVNLSTSIITDTPTENLYSIIIALAIGGGASLQAVAGAYLVRRFAYFQNLLTREKEIFLFLLYGGLFSALINSTIAVSTLVIIGQIPRANFLVNWGTWWMGDVLGIFIFTPLVLAWMQKPSEPWRNRRIAITFPISVMFVLTVAAVFYESQNNKEQLKLEFDQHAVELKQALESSILMHINVLHSLESFYLGSTTIEREDFLNFVTHALTHSSGIQALSWNPMILSTERNTFEKNLQRKGYNHARITEKNANNQISIAANRAVYVPIDFIEPYRGNESAVGYDVYSNDLRREAIDRARDSGEIATTARITLIQENGKQYGALAFLPIYRKNLPHHSLEERRHNILGYMVAVFRGGDIVTAALKDLNRAGLSYRLLDENAPLAERLIFASNENSSPLILQEKGLFGRNLTLTSSLVIPVGGRSWRFEVTPTQDYFAYHRSGNAWLILVAGLILTSMVAAFTLVFSGRRSLLRKLVDERTTELLQSEQRFRVIADAAPVLIWLADTDKSCFWFNKVWLEFTGSTIEQEAGNGWANGVHPDDLQRCLAIYVGHFERRESFQMDYRLMRHDGKYRWVKDHGVPRFDANKIFTGYIGSCIDVTDQITALDEASRAKEALEKVLYSATEISITSTDPQGVFSIFNRGAELMLGYSAEEMVGKQSLTLIHDPGEIAQCRRELCLELERPVSAFEVFMVTASRAKLEKREWTYVRKDQSTVTVSLTVTTILDHNDEITGYLSIAEDISDRKQNEAIILLAKDRAEALARSKSEFLANMSHEIRTPMNAIIGLSYLALNKDMSLETRDYLEKIYVSSNGLLNILNDILDFSRLEADRVTIDHSAFDLGAMQANLTTLFAESAKKKKHLDLILRLAPDVPLNVVGDNLRLQQILTNLLGNAIKFTDHGTVALTITLQQLKQSQARLLFSVTDTGIGMSDDDRNKLFQPFSQVDSSITRRFGGTGLGLAISHSLLQLMGGEFLVASTPGKGSSFSFELVLGVLPLSSKPASQKTTLALAELGRLLVGTRILVAEDNLINQQVVQEFLQLSGVIVEIANNGKEALALLEINEFDAVLMDMHMPILDGIEATKLIRSQDRFAQLPIIALTAGVTKEEQNKCLASGMNDFIGKPINPKKLMSTLVHWIKSIDENAATVMDSHSVESAIASTSNTAPLPVLDPSNLMLMLDNNQALVTRLLMTFIEEMSDLPDEIEARVTEGNIVAARKLVHRIKGASGNIGALRLHAAAASLETDLNGELTLSSLASFRDVFNQTVSVITAKHLPAPVSFSTAGSREALKSKVAELDLLLKTNDFISDVMLNTLMSHLAVDQLEWFAQLRKLINNFQYDEASKALQQFSATILCNNLTGTIRNEHEIS